MQAITTAAATPHPADLTSVVNQCYQCCKCSAGCPVATEMDLLPHQMVRLAVLGQKERIVQSKSIWLCLTCHTCGARCPNGIDVPGLLDPIRHQMLKEGKAATIPEVPAFHNTFMKTIRTFGRIHELFLIGMYKWKTKTFMADKELGMKMFSKGKIHIWPHWAKNVGKVKELFKQSSLR
ncbi:MAG: 4Fe-4S dicluster domain-containing protein [Thermodesulfobacteriota bacterium]